MSIILQIIAFVRSLGEILGFFKKILPTPTDKIIDKKNEIDKQEDEMKKTGRPVWKD